MKKILQILIFSVLFLSSGCTIFQSTEKKREAKVIEFVMDEVMAWGECIDCRMKLPEMNGNYSACDTPLLKFYLNNEKRANTYIIWAYSKKSTVDSMAAKTTIMFLSAAKVWQKYPHRLNEIYNNSERF